MVNPRSLGATIDVVNETFFYGKTFTKSQKEEIAKWIAGRQGLAGSYAHMFAPTDYDFKKGIRLFTGEQIRRGAAIGHILGEEACRTLLLLNVKENDIKNGLKRATRGMLSALQYHGRRQIGWYCCGTCSSSYWRHLAAGGLNNNRKRLAAGLLILKKLRDNKGSWHRMPFFYTLLALSEIDLAGAKEEMRYAAHRCEKYLKYGRKNSKYSMRRQHLARKILERC